jgi:predicted ester cyclase
MEITATEDRRLDADFARGWFERFVAAWNSHDPEALTRLCTRDVLWEDPLIVPTGSLRGREALGDWLASVFRAFPDIVFDWDGQPFLSADGTEVAAPWRATARMTGTLSPPGFAPTGAPVAATGVDIHAFRDDLLCHVRTTTDVHDWAVQMGAAPPAGSAGERFGIVFQRLTARRMRRSRQRGRR